MKLKNIFRKAVVVGTGITLVGSTALGALAYDLSTYPAKFIVDGKFDGQIVLGANANAIDVIGAIDIAASLQVSTVTKTPPVYHGEIILGDVKSINGGKTALRSKPTPLLSATDIKAFATQKITNSLGTTDMEQYIKLGGNVTSNYLENDKDMLADYMVISGTTPFFEWEERFPDGFKSKRDSDDKLKDYDDMTIGLVGAPSVITSSSIKDDGTDFTMTLMAGSVGDTLREGETKTYNIKGKDYEVTLVFISDPNQGDVEAKFSVNGEITQALGQGDTDTLSDGLQIGVRDLLVNAREGIASFYLGARKVVITDPTPSAENYDGTVEVDNENIGEGVVQVMGNYDSTNSTFRIAWIKYRYTADSLEGGKVFMPAGGLLRERIKRPEGMLSDIEFHYHGLVPQETRPLSITRKNENQYEMTFSNVDGVKYEFPFISNKDGEWKYGDDNDDLVFAEAANGATPNIGKDDYFIVSNSKTGIDIDKSVTHVLRYTDYDPTDLTATFERQSDKRIFKVPVTTDGIGYLIPGAQVYKINVSDVTAKSPDLAIDQDATGTWTGVGLKVVTWGGLVVNIAQNVPLNDTMNASTASNPSKITGNGVLISGAQAFSDGDGTIQMSGQILAKNFAKLSPDENFNWTVMQANNDEVDLSMDNTEYDGPTNTDFSDENTGFIFTDDGDTDHTKGLTDWGTLIDKYSPSDHPSELTLNIPQTQRFTQMFVAIGQVVHGGPVPGTVEKVNPIGVGIAMLDTDVAALDADNMIVVGGPCINSVAKQLLAAGDDCAAGFAPDSAMIKTFENGEKVAILVAGYEAKDTLRASETLTMYKTKPLKGTSVDVSLVAAPVAPTKS